MATARGAQPPSSGPDLGPTLPALLRQRFGVPERVTAVVAALIVLLAVLTVALRPFGAADKQVIHRAEPVFNLVYPTDRVREVAPHPGELVRLEAHRRSLSVAVTVTPLRLPPYAGNVPFGLLPAYADGYVQRLRARTPGFRLTDEGKARVGDTVGYQVGFSAQSSGRLEWGRDIMLVPKQTGVRLGVVLTLRQSKTGGPPGKRDQPAIDAVKSAFRSFRFGTEGA